MKTCEFCNKELSDNVGGFIKHKKYCKENPNHLTQTSNFIKYNKNRIPTNQYIKAKNEGKPIPKMSEKTKKKISNASKINNKKYFSNPENKIKQSIAMKKAVIKNPESYSSSNVCGRVQQIKTIDTLGNETKLNGRWELKVANFFISKNIKWTNKIEPSNYFWNNGWHLYFPDFYLPELNIYVEVKGYERERDRCKWKYFKSKLLIIKIKEINDLDNWYNENISTLNSVGRVLSS